MKKLLVLLLVLGIASAASAVSLTLTQPDATVMEAVVGGDIDQDLYICLVSDAAVAISMLVPDAPDLSGYSGAASDLAGLFPVSSPAGLAYAGEYWVMATSDSVNYPIVGGDYLTGAGAEGDWLYAFWFDEATFTPTMIGEIQLVPEPMTIALLGLGGLMMLRRRK